MGLSGVGNPDAEKVSSIRKQGLCTNHTLKGSYAKCKSFHHDPIGVDL